MTAKHTNRCSRTKKKTYFCHECKYYNKELSSRAYSDIRNKMSRFFAHNALDAFSIQTLACALFCSFLPIPWTLYVPLLTRSFPSFWQVKAYYFPQFDGRRPFLNMAQSLQPTLFPTTPLKVPSSFNRPLLTPPDSPISTPFSDK